MRWAWVVCSLLALACARKSSPPERDAGAGPEDATSEGPIESGDASAARSLSDAPPDAGTASLVILAGGDVNLGRGAGQEILKDPKYNPLREMAPLFRSADLRIVNLESQLSEQRGETQSPRNRLIFTGPPGGADALANAGVDVVSLANNHAWDYGRKALFETIANLERANVRYAGASVDRNAQYEPRVLTVKGKRIAIFAVTHIWNQPPFTEHEGQFHVAWASTERLRARLVRARKESDVVLLLYHGGGEYVDVPMQWTRIFMREVMSLGIDAVIGHHPHIPHGVGWFGRRPVFYSLGNLVFAMHTDYPWTGTGFMARLTFEDGRTKAEACPYDIVGHVPTPFSGAFRERRQAVFKRHLELLSITVGRTRISDPNPDDGCFELEPPS